MHNDNNTKQIHSNREVNFNKTNNHLLNNHNTQAKYKITYF